MTTTEVARGLRFVGVRRYPESARLLAEGSPRRATVASVDLAYDCVRHRDFLSRVMADESAEAMRETLYWRYLVSTGRTADAADARCRGFAELLESIRTDGFDASRGESIAVTDDGIRLNGSHRAAIAQALALGAVEVALYSWRAVFSTRRIRHILEEARVKREAQAAFVGREVALAGEDEPHGRVAYVDADVPSRLLSRIGRPVRPVLVVERQSGTLERSEPSEVALR